MEVIEARYREPWTVERLARQVGCNRTTLEQDFKDLTGMTVHACLVRRRIAVAVELLVRATEGLKRIAG